MDRVESKFTGIVKRESDQSQPFRVWYEGRIIQFCKTSLEAETYLEEARDIHRRIKAMSVNTPG